VKTRGQSLINPLLRASVTPATESHYQKSAEGFIHWCLERRFDWADFETLDSRLADYMLALFNAAVARAEANYVLAAIKFFTYATCLPRASRAIRGWTRLSPSGQRLPVPRVVAAAIAFQLVLMNQPMMAVATMLTFVAYLRPGETMKLLARHVIAPSTQAGAPFACWALLLGDLLLGPTKTFHYHDGVTIDLDTWIWPILEALVRGIPPNWPLWQFTYPQWAAAFASACSVLRLEPLHPHIYSLRHGGASEDLLAKRRTLAEVKHRGRWVTDASLSRYSKPAHLQAVLAKVPPHVLRLGMAVMRDFPAALQGRATM
jgi:hypothetical protein